MQEENHDEISLREIIETVWDGKWIIAAITAIAVLISGLFSFLIMDPVYEARATFMINIPKSSEAEVGDAMDAVLKSYSQYPQLTMKSYVEQVKNSTIMQNVINQLNLDEEGMTYEDLRNKITTEIVQDTNLLRIKVSDNDPQLAFNIASAVSSEFVQFINDKIQEQMLKSAELLKQQMDQEEIRYAEEAEQMKVFLQQPTSVQELSQEITSRLEQLTKYKIQLDDIEVSLRESQAGLTETNTQLASTPQVIVTQKSLASDSYMQSVVAEENNQSQAETGSYVLTDEEVNPVYTNLKQKAANYQIEAKTLESKKAEIQERISNNQDKLEGLQVEHADKQMEHEQLQIRVNNAKNMYNTFANKYEEARVTGTALFGDSNMMIVAPAMEPINPVGPNKKLNIAIAAIIGLMLGAGIVFARHYWISSTPGYVNHSKGNTLES